MGFVFLDGKLVEESQAMISVHDRGFLLGDGVYSTIQVRDGRPLFLDRHFERLEKQAKAIHLTTPSLRYEDVEAFIQANKANVGIHRMKIIVTGGMDPQMRLPKRAYGHHIMTIKPFIPSPYAPLNLAIFPLPVSLCHASYKSLAHLNRYYVMEYACQQGCDDAVTLSEKGILLEASFGNLLWITDKGVFTPEPTLSLHYGVTLSVLVEQLELQKIPVHYVQSTIEEIPSDAAVFRVNSMSKIRPIQRIGSKIFEEQKRVAQFLEELWQEAATTEYITS